MIPNHCFCLNACLSIYTYVAPQTLLRVFADSLDTDGDGDELLLTLYQAQITSALRQALAGGALCVAVRCAASEAAVVFSQSGVMSHALVQPHPTPSYDLTPHHTTDVGMTRKRQENMLISIIAYRC
jgi:hypothetical protein